MIFQGMMAFFATLGFGILFHVPNKYLLYLSLIGMFGGIAYEISAFYFGITIALFIASFLISLLSELAARYLHCPTSLFLLCALVPLVPGGLMYKTVLAIINEEYTQAFMDGIATLSGACAIVMGCTLVTSIFLMLRNKKMCKK